MGKGRSASRLGAWRHVVKGIGARNTHLHDGLGIPLLPPPRHLTSQKCPRPPSARSRPPPRPRCPWCKSCRSQSARRRALRRGRGARRRGGGRGVSKCGQRCLEEAWGLRGVGIPRFAPASTSHRQHCNHPQNCQQDPQPRPCRSALAPRPLLGRASPPRGSEPRRTCRPQQYPSGRHLEI